MIRNYFLAGIRNLRRNKWLAFLNITGLLISFTCGIGILLFVEDELSYDSWIPDAEKIYRVIQVGEEMEHSSSMPFPTAPALFNDYGSDIDHYTRVFNFQASTLSVVYENPADRKIFNEPRFFFADSTFFRTFPFQFIKGNRATALNGPNQVVVTAETALRYFGTEDPIGKVLKFEGKQDLLVTGVVSEVPSNTHFTFDFIASFRTLETLFDNGIPEKNWYWNPVWTYVVLKDPARAAVLEAGFPEFVKKYYHPSLQKAVIKLQPLNQIYLHSHTEYEIGVMSDIKYIYIFSILGFSILAIAVINFINLTTAYGAERFKEIGIRKVVGADRKNIIMQFVSESVVMSLIAFVFAVALLFLMLPFLNDLTGKSFSVESIVQWRFVITVLGLALVIGIIAGYYPALVLAGRNAVDVLKANISPNTGRILLRKVLVAFQFAVSIIFISGTLVAYLQLDYMKNANLGFSGEEVLVIPIQRTSMVPRFDSFKKELLRNPDVRQVTTSNVVIGKDFQTSNYKRTGWDDPVMYPSIFVKDDFINTMSIGLVAGRDFTEADKHTLGAKAIINIPMMKSLGWEDPDAAIGEEIDGTLEGRIKIIGVCNAFHYASLHQDAGPVILINIEGSLGTFLMNFILVKINSREPQATINFIGTKWAEFVPETLFDYSFLNDNLDKIYQKEEKFSRISTFFSIVAILIGAIGLFGLTMFAVQKRKKEISIRKVLGGSTFSILNLLTREFFHLLIFASLVAIPLSIYLMKLWLSGFAYQVPFSILPFVVSVLVLFFTTMFIVATQVVKTSRSNPALVLRSE
jgi:putative ABC transport system permease protein